MGLAARPEQRAQADAYAAWLVANAVELQVAVVIWNGRIWAWGRRAEGWRPYRGTFRHTDHIHVDLSWEGALHPSPLLSGPVPGLGGAPAPVPGPGPTPRPGPRPSTGSCKAPPAHVVQFVRDFHAHALRSQRETGVPWLVSLGQAAQESGWGKRAPGNNFFGVKARATDPPATRQLLRTREVCKRTGVVFPEVISVNPRPDGRYDYVVRDWFRVFPSPSEAFVAHGRFLRDNRRYAAAFTQAADPYAFALAVAAAGYATDPSYAVVLTGVMRLIERTAGS
ncbi:glucosaminidase domain-containing protein [Streptomyces sp. NPDC041003]|uniref:glycoside hydrolase family 73 protein n=1 Tax=Streptomyces sp. NPDC041003 TaxID=3155730 RepID=UPI0033ED230B